MHVINELCYFSSRGIQYLWRGSHPYEPLPDCFLGEYYLFDLYLDVHEDANMDFEYYICLFDYFYLLAFAYNTIVVFSSFRSWCLGWGPALERSSCYQCW